MTALVTAAAALTLAALAALLWPLLRSRGGASESAHELAVYRDQLAEIDRDLARGLIRPEEAAAARLEVERRLLRVASAAETAPSRATTRGRLVLLASAVLVPALSAALYLHLGAPDLPDEPLAARQEELAQSAAPQVKEMVARLEARLKDKPDDLEGWLMLARSKAALDDAPAAVAAYRKAAALAPDDPRAEAGLAETLTIAQGGVVPPEAKALFEKIQAKGTGEDPRPGYYLGLAAAQAGDGPKALDLWRDLLARTPADAPWRPRIEEAIRTAAGDFGLDAGPVLAQAGPPAAAAPDKPAAGAGDAMTPEQRSEFIRGMVGKLEAKLDADGSDPVGWLRLGQARLVLGEPDKARAAYERGLALHPDDSGLLKAEAALLLGPPASADALPRVSDDAAKLYARAAAAAPDDPEPQWFLGVRALQDGRQDEARERWRRVLSRLGPDQPDYAMVKQRLDSLGG